MRDPIRLNLPSGNMWAVGVSGGADSVALLLLLRDFPSLKLRAVHLDHELRGSESAADAAFVQQLCGHLAIPCDVARRSEITLNDPPLNPSACYRAARLAFFQQIVHQHHLDGVMLAHHADDVAETVLQRLIRGSGPSGLAGMADLSVLNGLVVARPLLQVRRETLRNFLKSRNQDWREDASNQTDDYLRNRLRKILTSRPSLTEALLNLAQECRRLRQWTSQAAPKLEDAFAVQSLAALPRILARQSARQWLLSIGEPSEDVTTEALDRLISMAADAATPGRQQFPGGLVVRRKDRKIAAIDRFR